MSGLILNIPGLVSAGNGGTPLIFQLDDDSDFTLDDDGQLELE